MTRTLGACCLIKWPKITVAVAASRQEQKQQTQHMTHGPANSGRSVQHHRPITARPTCSQTHEATTPPCCHRGRHDATHAAQAQLLSLCFTEQTTLPYTPAKGTAHTTHERHSSNSHGGTQPVDLQTNPSPPRNTRLLHDHKLPAKTWSRGCAHDGTKQKPGRTAERGHMT